MSDELGFTAQGVETITRKDLDTDLHRIEELVGNYGAEEIVVGIPYNMNGSEGPQVRTVRTMIEHITSRIDVAVREWDERLSTVAAERALLEANVSRAKRRKVIDKLAAVIILQGYLDGLSNEV